MDEYGDFQQFEELNPLVLKFESMLLKGENPFFDIDEYEEIIEHYLITNLSHAEIVVDYALSQYPWNTAILLKKAIIAAQNEKPEEAFEIVNTVRSIDSNNMDFYVTISYIHRILNEFDKSIKALKQALKFKEDVEEVYFDIAEDYFMLGDYNKECMYLKECLKIKSDYPEAIEKLFWSYKSQQNFQDAVDFFQSFTDKHPLQQNAWEKLGFSYYEIGLFEKSVEAFEYSLSISDRTTSFNGIAHAFWKLDLQFHAISILNEAIEKFPYSFDLNILIGWIYLDVKDYLNAQKYFLNEIFLNSTSNEAWKGLAQTYVYYKDFNNAYSCVQKSIMQSQSDLDSLIQLAYLAGEIDLPKNEIEDIFKTAIDKFPNNENAFLEYSSFLYLEDQQINAIKLLETALTNIENSAPIFYRIAAFHYGVGNETIGHLNLIAGLTADPKLLHLMFDFDQNLIENKSIIDIVESFTNNDNTNEDI